MARASTGESLPLRIVLMEAAERSGGESLPLRHVLWNLNFLMVVVNGEVSELAEGTRLEIA